MKNIYKKMMYCAFFLIPIIISFLYVTQVDNDMWYLLSEGRYIVQNGIYKIDPLSMHEGLSVVVQNWASASIFWIVYSLLGKYGLLLLTIIINFIICVLIYKICMLLSDNNTIISLVIMLVNDLILLQNYLVTRPQIFSFVILLLLILSLELYIKKDKIKYLVIIPFLSIIEANIHASLWLMIFLFMIPYIIDAFKIPYIKTQKYRIKPLIIIFIVSFFSGLINPYGYKVITFIFTSFSDRYMHLYINELLPFTFYYEGICFIAYVVILITSLMYFYFRNGNIRIRYICLYFGTMLLGLISVKGFSHFFLVSFFPFAYFFKDILPTSRDGIGKAFKFIYRVGLPVIFALCVICFAFLAPYSFKNFSMSNDAEAIFDGLEPYATKGQTMYTTFNDGGYAEFRGYKSYIDPRAEVFLKINNKKKDIFYENYQLNHGQIGYKEFIDFYKFDYILINFDDEMVYYMLDYDQDYFIISDDLYSRYRIYARKDLFDEETIQKIESSF